MSQATLRALIIDTDAEHNAPLTTLLRSAGFEVQVTGGTIPDGLAPCIAFLCMDLQEPDSLQLLADERLQNAVEVVLMAEQDDPARVRRGIAQGATYFFCKPFDPGFLEPLLRDVHAELTVVSHSPGPVPSPPLDQFGQLRGSSPPMRRLYRLLRKVAPTRASVLLIGESGTGKELAASTLHQMSAVADGPLVAMNCAAVPKDLFESELFGHEKGSFSGAERRHAGFFERATGGTLFLDEITEMPIELQAKLLRLLEVGAFRRVGGEVDVQSDVRIVAATNREPDDAIAQGLLREDLYYRIARFPIWLPPLRQRADDVIGLARFFVDGLNLENGSAISIGTDALKEIERHAWPGNVRELRSAVERAYILADSEIGAEHLPDLADPAGGQHLRIAVGDAIEDVERQLIFATLDANGGDKKLTAETLGVSLKTLYNRLNQYAADSADKPQRE